MRRVFTEAWTASGGLDLVGRDTVLEVPESRVFDAHQEESRLVIRQSVQARNRQSNQNLEARYEVRYFLSPYRPGAFEGKELEALDARYLRYFETEGQIEPVTGRVSAHRAVRYPQSGGVLLFGQHPVELRRGGPGRHPLLEPGVRQRGPAGGKGAGRRHRTRCEA